MTRLPPNSIRLYHRDTERGKDLYPLLLNQRTARTQNALWDRRVVTGPVSADAEQYLSSWTQDDYSSGFGVEDANETTDTSRIAFGVIDTRHPKNVVLPPLPTLLAKPSWASGNAYPLGDIGTQFYGAWAQGVAGFNSGTGALYTTQNSWPGTFTTPKKKPVTFCGKMYVAGGSGGIAILSELTPATGTLTVQHQSSITAVALGLHDGCLWAIDTNNHLWQLTVAGAQADPTNPSNWQEIADTLKNPTILDTSLTPTRLLNWWNASQEETLWCITQGQGAYMLDAGRRNWIKGMIKEGSDPNWGLTAEIFRDGEDMFIGAGGLDLSRQTVSNVEVPLSGPSKDQGVPPEYQGQIVDLLSERSCLYALVKGRDAVAAGTPTSTWTLQQRVGHLGATSGNFDNPQQVAVDSSGNVFVADRDNNRIQKFNSSGVWQQSITIAAPIGVAVDSSGNLYVTYNSTYHAQLTAGTYAIAYSVDHSAGGGSVSHIATDNTYVYIVRPGNTNGQIVKYPTGAGVSPWAVGGTVGSGNGQFNAPVGIVTDGTHVYVADAGNNRIQKLLKSDGSYVAKWNTSGGSGLCTDDSGDIWSLNTNGYYAERYSNAGVFQTSFYTPSPVGIGRATGDILWISSNNHTLSEWDEESVSTPAVTTKSWLAAWTGTAWCALWDVDKLSTTDPTQLALAIVDDPALWWSMGSFLVYSKLPPPFFNPASRVAFSGDYPFNNTGWLETVRFDANMSGWDKIASHFYVMMQYAAPECSVAISYRTDADQYDSGLSDPPYRTWKTIDTIGRTLCWFDDTENDDISQLPWHEGESFQWIQFRFDFYTSDTSRSPIWMWHSLHFMAVPQDSSTMQFTVPLKDGKTFNRDGDEMAETLRSMQRLRKMVHLQVRNPDPRHPERKVVFRGRVTQVKSEFYAGEDNSLDEVVTFQFVELEAADNEHTTVAA